MTEHSILGASSSERWMHCPGSVHLLDFLDPDATAPEKDYTREGSAAHEAAKHCLLNFMDTWEVLGQEFLGLVLKDDDLLALQVFLDEVRKYWDNSSVLFVETTVGKDAEGNQPHKAFKGTVDFAGLTPQELVVMDLKFGVGVLVDPEENTQMMYYAYGILLKCPEIPDDFPVLLKIVQPRAQTGDTVKEWITTAGHIRTWAVEDLLPAMNAAMSSVDLLPGEWCRFCPSRTVCPALKGMFRAAINTKCTASAMTDAELGLEFSQIEFVKMYIRAIEDEAYNRSMAGKKIPGTKLVNKKSNRVFKDGAEAVLAARFGEVVYNPPTLKSPAQIEKIGKDAKAVVSEWAYAPDTGLSLVSETDKRATITVQKPQDIFAGWLETMAPSGHV